MVSQSGPPGQAPIDPSQLALALAPFGQSRMLPREAYVSDEVFAFEQTAFFEQGWSCLGRSDLISQPGDQRAEAVGRGSVLLMRDDEGVAHAFANACRHRNHELLQVGEVVNRPIVLCPYHAWSYRLSGELRRAPSFSGTEGFDESCHGLVELRLVEWHGFLFVDPSGRAGEFAEHVAGLEEIVAPYGLEDLVTAGRHDYVVAANWKILSENYQECYHCPVIHPELCAASPPRSGDNYVHPGSGAWVGGYMDLDANFPTMALEPGVGGEPLPGLDEHRRRIVDYIGLFPNVLLSLHPDYVMTHVLTPLGPAETRVVCEWHFSPDAVSKDGFDPSYAVEFWDVTNRQDWHACESVQRGLTSPHAVPGPLSAEEDGVYQFVTMVAAAYQGRPPRPGGTRPGSEESALSSVGA